MRIFENREDEALFLSREDQVPLAKEPGGQYLKWPTPLLKEALPLETFPLIEDFEVVLLPMPAGWKPRRKRWDYHLGFFSQQQGLLASFGILGTQAAPLDYSQENVAIPLDFWDFEQAWEQVIFEKDEYVYVLESNFDDHTSGYHCWFRVRKERYLSEWQAALEACRRMIRQMEGK